LPEPVWPYAKIVPLYPSKHESITFMGDQVRGTYIFGDLVEDRLLLCEHVEDSIKDEVVDVVLLVLVA